MRQYMILLGNSLTAVSFLVTILGLMEYCSLAPAVAGWSFVAFCLHLAIELEPGRGLGK